MCFRSLIGNFVSLPLAFEIMTAFLAGGIKIIFRYTYAIMKYHKNFIKTLQSPSDFVEKVRIESKENTNP